MVKELQYTTINRVLDDLMEHPLLSDLTLEQVVRHTVRFISIHGYPRLYEDKIEDVRIKDFRGELPCDLISIIQVKDLHTGVCLRSMTDDFPKGAHNHCHPDCLPKDFTGNVVPRHGLYIPPLLARHGELAFKTQGRVIYTSFPKGMVEVAYKAMPVDENGYPMIVDNENFLAALEAYIKKQVFTVKFDLGKVSAGVLQNAQTDYAWLAGELNAEFTIPSMSEMESITRMLNTMIPQVRHFDRGFNHLGDREYIRRH